MSTFRLPHPRLYWHEGIEKITQHFTINRFEELRANIHFNSDAFSEDYTEKSGEKAQPLIDMINARLSLLQMPNKHLCIDEMMVPSKSKYGPRVYQKGKPHPWGYKLFSIADETGVTFRVHLHSGKFAQVLPHPNLGSTNNVALFPSLLYNIGDYLSEDT